MSITPWDTYDAHCHHEMLPKLKAQALKEAEEQTAEICKIATPEEFEAFVEKAKKIVED